MRSREMKITIDDIAQRAGVSKTTISRILNGNYSQTSEETRKRILDIVRELDYHPNELARGLKRAETNVMGILLSNLRNSFWTTVLEGVEDTCQANGYNLMICNSGDSREVESQYIKGFQRRKVDGIIVNPTTSNNELFAQLVNARYPVVVMNRKLYGLPVSTVVMDNTYGASAAVEHLISIGRQRIAIVTYEPKGISTWTERIEGYQRTLRRHGFTDDDFLIETVEQTKGATRAATRRLLTGPRRPDAIISASNVLTFEILEAIRESGLSMPEDVAFVSYDETEWAKHMQPPLTTIRQPAYEMGKLAVEQLIGVIKGTSVSTETTVLTPELIVRESTIGGMRRDSQ